MVEQWPFKPLVLGSSPRRPTKKRLVFDWSFFVCRAWDWEGVGKREFPASEGNGSRRFPWRAPGKGVRADPDGDPPKKDDFSSFFVFESHFLYSFLKTLMKTSLGTSTRPMDFIFFLPFFCLSRSLFLRVTSPPYRPTVTSLR